MAKILVVDDDERNLRRAATVHAQAGHVVLSAQDGAAGVAVALAQKPDLVLMDIQMPGTDGISAPRVAALTALAMKGGAERLLAVGFDGYLEKPMRYQAFLARVAALLAGERRESRAVPCGGRRTRRGAGAPPGRTARWHHRTRQRTGKDSTVSIKLQIGENS